MIDTAKHQTQAENVPKLRLWLATRGGLAVWGCQDFGNLGKTWTTPLNQEDGTPTPKPHWSATDQPIRVIYGPADVEVCVDKEVKRFRVGIRMGGQGMTVKVTDGGTRRIRAAVEKAGLGAYHVFDYYTQEAVIMAPDKVVPLTEWPE